MQDSGAADLEARVFEGDPEAAAEARQMPADDLLRRFRLIDNEVRVLEGVVTTMLHRRVFERTLELDSRLSQHRGREGGRGRGGEGEENQSPREREAEGAQKAGQVLNVFSH